MKVMLQKGIVELEEKKLGKIIENFFISKVMKETGLSRDCSIKYIQKYCNIVYESQTDGGFVAKMDLKTIRELSLEDKDFPYDCMKQLFKNENGKLKNEVYKSDS